MAVSEPPESSVPYRGQVFCSGLVFCSVCLEAVVDKGERSIAKLKCGHCFHLDCIGSAFNAKGAMQCPNCRQVEQGQWLFPNGCLPEDLAEDLTLETNYEMYTGISNIVHHEDEMFGHMPWCPFQGSHPHFSVSIEERNDLASRYPNTVANVRHHMRSAHPGINCPYLALETHPSTAAPLPYDRSLWPHHPSIPSSASSSTSALSDATTHGFPSIDRIAFLQAGAHPQTGGWLFQNPLFIHPGVQRRPNGVAIVPSGAGHHQSHGFGVNGSGAFLQPLAVNPSNNNNNNNNNSNNNNNNNNGVVGRRARSWGSVSSSAHSQRMMSQMDWHGSENEVESWIRGQAYAPRGPFGIHHWLTWVPPGRNS